MKTYSDNGKLNITINSEYLGNIIVKNLALQKIESESPLAIGYLYIGSTTQKQPFAVNKLFDTKESTVFYPYQLYLPKGKIHTAATSDKTAYHFYQNAKKYTNTELIHILMVNDSEEYLNNSVEQVYHFIQALLELSSKQEEQKLVIPQFEHFIASWHFTVYQQHQLRELLRRYSVILPQHNPHQACKGKRKASEILSYLHTQLANAEYHF